MHKRDIDVILAGTKPNVEYLTDVEWMRWFAKGNFLTEDGENYAPTFVGLPQDETTGPFYIAPSTQTGYPENYGVWIDDVRCLGPVFHDYSRLLLGQKEFARAEQLVGEGLVLARECELRPLAAKLNKLEVMVDAANSSGHPFGLTSRELEVLDLLTSGLTNRQIAEHFYVSHNTVGTHVKQIYSKTGCSNRAETTRFATECGLVAENA